MKRVGLSEQPVCNVNVVGKRVKFTFCRDKAPVGSYVLPNVKGSFSRGFPLGEVECHVYAQRKGNKVNVTFQLPSGVVVCEHATLEKRVKNAMKRPAKRAARAAKRRPAFSFN